MYTRPCNAGEPSPKISITAHLGEVSVSLSFSPSFSLSNLKFWWSPDVNGSRQDWDTLSSPLHYLLHLLLLLQLKHGWNVHFISILMHQSSVSSRVVELLTTATPSRGMTDSCGTCSQQRSVPVCLTLSLSPGRMTNADGGDVGVLAGISPLGCLIITRLPGLPLIIYRLCHAQPSW